MTFSEFKALIEDFLDIIPEKVFEGLQGVHVFESVKGSPEEPGLVRLGEYLDPGPEQFLDHRVHLGRHVALYYGSFAQIARFDPAFDWEEQAWETLTHELQHHVESKAGRIDLIEWDRRQLEAFRRNRGAQSWWGEVQ